MELTHNKINKSIQEMNAIVSKGQPFAKANKDRKIRKVLRDMESKQATPILFKELFFYFKLWVKAIWS